MAAVVVAWFVVLVPMVLTRRDNAVETVIRDNDTSSARVLRRKSHAARQQRRSLSMSARESSPSHDLDAAVDTAVHERIVDSEPPAYDEVPRERGPRRTDVARQRILQRRRQTLLGLSGFFLLTLALAAFAGTWTWVIAAASGVTVVAYMVHLRNERRREEERRLTRGVRANRAPSDVLDRSVERSQSSLAANAFVAPGPVSELEAVQLDDEDPELYDIGDSPVADAGYRSYSEYQSPNYYDWDYDSVEYDDAEYDDSAYGIDGPADPDQIRPAV